MNAEIGIKSKATNFNTLPSSKSTPPSISLAKARSIMHKMLKVLDYICAQSCVNSYTLPQSTHPHTHGEVEVVPKLANYAALAFLHLKLCARLGEGGSITCPRETNNRIHCNIGIPDGLGD